MLASSFMKLIFVASIAFAAYFVSSDDRMSMTIKRSWLRGERLIQGAHELGGPRIVGPDDDAVGLHEILDRRAFLEEFGVRYDVKLNVCAATGKRRRDFLTDLVGRANGHRRLGDDDAISVQMRGDRPRCAEYIAKIGRAVLVRRSSYRNELKKTVFNALHGVGGEFDSTGFGVALDQRIQAGLVNGDLTPVQALDLACVNVYTNDMVACIGQTGARDEADVARAENGYTHSGKFLSSKGERP